MITNDNKVPLKDLPAEEFKALHLLSRKDVEVLSCEAWWVAHDIGALTIDCIYRQKPKVLSPRELHIEVANMSESSGQRIDKAGVMKLIKRLEGYKDD